MSEARWGYGARIALTLVPVAALCVAASTLLLPGTEALVARAQRGGPTALFLPPSVSVFAIGVMPFIQAYFLVELVALAVPRLRRLRHGNPEGRSKLDRAARIAGLALAAVQSLLVAKQLAAISENNLFAQDLPSISVPVVTASLVGGACVAMLVAQLVTRQGIVNGFVLLATIDFVRDVASSIASAHERATVAGTWEPRHAAIVVGSIALPLLTGWIALRGSNETHVADTKEGTAYRDARALVVRPWVPVPSSSIAPYAVGIGLLTLPVTLAASKVPTHYLVEVLQDGTTFTIALLLLVAVLAFVFTRLLHRPADIEDLARKVGASVDGDLRNKVLGAQNAALAPTLLFFAALVTVGIAARTVPSFDLAAVNLPILSALALDAAAALRARGFAPVWEERRSAAVPIVRAVLEANGIEVRVSGAATHALFQAWAPYAPATILVPAADAERAAKVLQHLFGGGEAPSRRADVMPVTRPAPRWTARSRVLALGAVLAGGCGLYAVGRMLPSTEAAGPRSPAKLEVVRVNDDDDIFGELLTRELPPGVELRVENVRLGIGSEYERHYFLRTTLMPGESVESAIHRAEPVLRDVALPAGGRVVWGTMEDYDDETGRVTISGMRTYVLTGAAEITNDDIVEAAASLDAAMNPSQVYVAVTLADEAAERFRLLTREYTNRRLAILLDGRVTSAPVVRQEIGGGRMSITMGIGDPERMLKEAQALARGLSQRNAQ